MTYPDDILELAGALVKACSEKDIMLTTAESCTGGLVSGAITEIPGASECLGGAFVTYSNYLKTKLLGVPAGMLDEFGAVSEPVARAMAEGALKAAVADIGVAVTGIAGPTGGSPEKPVGLVHFASAHRAGHNIHTHHARHYIKKPDRHAIRIEAVRIALSLLLQEAKNYEGSP